jgi:hypothetical protein
MLRIAFTSGHNPELDQPEREKPKNEPGRIVTKPMYRENGSGFIDFEHRSHVWVIDAEGGEPKALTTGTFAEGAVAWSRDGRRVRFVSDRRMEPWFEHEASVLYAVDPELASPTDGAALEPVIQYRGMVGRWAEGPEGRVLFIGGIAPPSPRSYDQPTLMLAQGPWPCREPRDLTASLDTPVGEGLSGDQHPPRGGGEVPLAWAADGKSAIVAIVRRVGFLARVDIRRARRKNWRRLRSICQAPRRGGGLGARDRPPDAGRPHLFDATTVSRRSCSANGALLSEWRCRRSRSSRTRRSTGARCTAGS